MRTDSRLTVVQSFFARYFAGDIDEAVKLLEPTAVFHIPGHTGPAGDFVGPTAVSEHLRQFIELTEKPINVLSWDDWLVGTADIAGVVRLKLQRPGRFSAFRVIYLVEVSQNEKIANVECFFSDPEALARFFSW